MTRTLVAGLLFTFSNLIFAQSSPENNLREPMESSNIVAGRLISSSYVKYPKDARKQNFQGTVVLDATIEPDGQVSNIAVRSGEIMLAEAAIDAVETWKFEPYTKNGQPIKVRQALEFRFEPSKEEADFSPKLAPAVEVTRPQPFERAALQPNSTVYHVGHGITAPKAVFAPDPKYDKQARKGKHQGTCVLSMIVGPDGLPRDIRVTRAIGKGLDEKAVEAVQKWKFEPAIKDGRPVAVAINVEVQFRLY